MIALTPVEVGHRSGRLSQQVEAALRALPLSRDLELGRCDVLGTLLCADDTAGLTPGVISTALISSSSGTTKRSTGWSRTG